MATVGFIGLGNMGGPMAKNLMGAGHEVRVFDLSDEAVQASVADGGQKAGTVAEAVAGADVVVTMLPPASTYGPSIRAMTAYCPPCRVPRS